MKVNCAFLLLLILVTFTTNAESSSSNLRRRLNGEDDKFASTLEEVSTMAEDAQRPIDMMDGKKKKSHGLRAKIKSGFKLLKHEMEKAGVAALKALFTILSDNKVEKMIQTSLNSQALTNSPLSGVAKALSKYLEAHPEMFAKATERGKSYALQKAESRQNKARGEDAAAEQAGAGNGGYQQEGYDIESSGLPNGGGTPVGAPSSQYGQQYYAGQQQPPAQPWNTVNQNIGQLDGQQPQMWNAVQQAQQNFGQPPTQFSQQPQYPQYGPLTQEQHFQQYPGPPLAQPSGQFMNNNNPSQLPQYPQYGPLTQEQHFQQQYSNQHPNQFMNHNNPSQFSQGPQYPQANPQYDIDSGLPMQQPQDMPSFADPPTRDYGGGDNDF